jgi:2,3-bisphosphoglycerate-dependent phosphoglycerate mutase
MRKNSEQDSHMGTNKIILVRHGESLWNHENRFTGWQDVDLSEKGLEEAKEAGRIIKDFCQKESWEFDLCYTSYLRRAIKTLWEIQDQMDRLWLPVKKDWRWNERHYGALTGLNKAETAAKHGEHQVKIWRRSYDQAPPPMEMDDARHPSKDIKYASIEASKLPSCESLKDTVARFLPLWQKEISPLVGEGKKILIAAHGNSLRALVQHLEKLTPEQIMEVNIPTGIPFVYELDSQQKVISKKYLGDPVKVQQAMDHVSGQGKAK